MLWKYIVKALNPEMKILVSGKPGVGKSCLVNALLGQKIAAEGHSLKPETTEVSY